MYGWRAGGSSVKNSPRLTCTGSGKVAWRRSVYVYRKRGLPLPLFEIFDLPNQNLSCGARNVSTVPTQALTSPVEHDAFRARAGVETAVDQ